MRLRVSNVGVAKLLIDLKSFVYRHADGVGRNHLAEALHIGHRHSESTAGVAQHSPRLQGSKGDDLGNSRLRGVVLMRAILFGDVLDDLGPASILEIHVYIRHLNALRVKEALKGETVFHGVYVGDPDEIRDEAAGS